MRYSLGDVHHQEVQHLLLTTFPSMWWFRRSLFLAALVFFSSSISLAMTFVPKTMIVYRQPGILLVRTCAMAPSSNFVGSIYVALQFSRSEADATYEGLGRIHSIPRGQLDSGIYSIELTCEIQNQEPSIWRLRMCAVDKQVKRL